MKGAHRVIATNLQPVLRRNFQEGHVPSYYVYDSYGIYTKKKSKPKQKLDSSRSITTHKKRVPSGQSFLPNLSQNQVIDTRKKRSVIRSNHGTLETLPDKRSHLNIRRKSNNSDEPDAYAVYPSSTLPSALKPRLHL